jgi:acyl carrier protein
VSVGFDALIAVRDAVAIVCEVDAGTLSAATEFAELGADSLSRVSIADLVEAAAARPQLHIDDASLCRMTTLGDLADYVASQLAQADPLSVAS